MEDSKLVVFFIRNLLKTFSNLRWEALCQRDSLEENADDWTY